MVLTMVDARIATILTVSHRVGEQRRNPAHCGHSLRAADAATWSGDPISIPAAKGWMIESPSDF